MANTIYSSDESEMTVEASPRGIEMAVAAGDGLLARLTLNDEQAVLLADAIHEALAEYRETMEPKFAEETALPNDPAEFERKIGGLVEEYIWTEALRDEWDLRAPLMPRQPDIMKVSEWYSFCEQRDETQTKMNAWKELGHKIDTHLMILTGQIGETMPEAVKLIIPVFSGWCSVWASIGGRKEYLLIIENYRADLKPQLIKNPVTSLFSKVSQP